MQRCLFVIEDTIPLTPNFSGGASALAYSHFQLLANARVELSLLVLANDSEQSLFETYKSRYPNEWQYVQSQCRDWDIITIERDSRQNRPLRNMLDQIMDPSSPYGRISQKTRTKIKQLLDSTKPDFIWASDLGPSSIFAYNFPDTKVIYAHYDWKWKIKHHRRGRDGDTDLRWLVKRSLTRRHEESLVRKVAYSVTGSYTEAQEIERLGGHAVYFPTLYTPQEFPAITFDISKPRIVHLGGMQTTANRLGLRRFSQVVWPILTNGESSLPDLWVIGQLDGADAALQEWLDVNATCTGFVADLDDVMRPYDIHIVPWEYDTGTRTRIPLALSYGQVLVSTRASAACLPELKHNENAILVDNLEKMAWEIHDLLRNEDRRKHLGRSAYQVFINHYTQPALQPRFNEFIHGV